MADYIPKDDAGRVNWLTNFAAWLTLHGGAHGFNPTEIANMSSAASAAQTGLTNHIGQQAAARAATQTKNLNIATAIDMARADAQRLQHDPNMTDADRAGAGITVPDTTPTPGGTGAGGDILRIAPPMLLLDFNVRRQVTVHWGPNPSDEHNNARPVGCPFNPQSAI